MINYLILFIVYLPLIVFAKPTVEQSKANPIRPQDIRRALQASALRFGENLIQPPAQLKSQKYEWLLNDSVQRQDFLNKTKIEAQKELLQSPQLSKIQNFLMSQLKADEQGLLKEILSTTRSVVVDKINYEKTVYDYESAVKNPILSTADYLPKKADIIGLKSSPDKRYIAIQIQLDGNIDLSRIVVYDSLNKLVSVEFDALTFLDSVHWYSNTEIASAHPAANAKFFSSMIINVESKQSKTLPNVGIITFGDWVGTADYISDIVYLRNQKTGQALNYQGLSTANFSFEDQNYFYFIDSESKENHDSIARIQKQNLASVEYLTTPRNEQWLSSLEELDPSIMLAVYSRDSIQTLALSDKSGKSISELILPDGISYDYTISAQNGVVEISVSDFVNNSYDIKWITSDPVKTDLSSIPTTFKELNSDLEIVTRIEYFKSADGVLIPARLIHLKNINLTGENPVFMEVYGGFNLDGYLTKNLNTIKKEFLKRGGILVGTGVRGGSERGHAWYEAGSAENELNTENDVIAIAKGLVDRGYTIAKKVVLTGTSNGGYVTGATAQISPESFGLVIPINGVQDQFAFPDMDRWGLSWESEYLNPFETINFSRISKRAPVEMLVPANSYPEFLIINGEYDSRVNKVHSYKLKANLDESGKVKSTLLSVDHAGHWPTTTYLLGKTGVEANSIMWTKIFDYLNMQF